MEFRQDPTIMNSKVKRLWINSLRSGEYKQIQGCLKDEYGYCCLGVLCDLFLKFNNEQESSWVDHNFVVDSERGDSVLLDTVQNWAELNSGDPIIGNNLKAIEANDVSELSFEEIANLIEENL